MYGFTRKFSVAFSFLGIEAISKTILYYFHDKLWDKIIRGTHKYKPLAISISWRVVATVTTFIILKFFTETKVAFTASITEIIIKSIVFYFHEHLWQYIQKREIL